MSVGKLFVGQEAVPHTTKMKFGEKLFVLNERVFGMTSLLPTQFWLQRT